MNHDGASRTTATLCASLSLLAIALLACDAKVDEPTESVGRLAQAGTNPTDTPAWPTDAQWLALTLNNGALFDILKDKSGDADIVGDATHPSLYVYSDAVHLFWRLRVNGNPVSAGGLPNFNNTLWTCLLNTDATSTTYEWLTWVNGKTPSPDLAEVWQNTSTATPDSPSDPPEVLTSSVNITSGSTAHARAVDTATTSSPSSFPTNNTADPDFFVDGAFELSAFGGAVGPSTPLRFTCGTSETAQGLNGDFTSQANATTLSALASDSVLCGPAGCVSCNTGAACGVSCATCSGAAPVCDATAGSCAACNGDNGSSATLACPTSASPYCAGGGTCGKCTGAADCVSGTHAGPICNTSTGACSGACTDDTQCGATAWCTTTANACTPKLANGVAIPSNEPTHAPALSGTCTADVGTAVCASGVCDTVDNKCGFANGDGACTSGNATTVCRSGVCGSDGKCGLVDGEGVCNSVNAASVCRSGACGSASGVCVPAGGAGCAADGDCAAGAFCDTGTRTCTPTLANGAAIPTITGHAPPLTGVCSGAVAAAVCASGACDATANVCGIELGNGTCAGTAQCIAGVCVATGTNSGKCEPCVADATCNGPTPACNTATNTCVACTASSNAACTGTKPACDTATNTCVACNGDNGTSATAPCSTVVNPYCASAGACAKCAGDADCVGNHPGAICNLVTGVCGTACTTDGNCTAQQWCDNPTAAASAGVCTAKVANGQPVPASAPINATCTQPVGARVCSSGVCTVADNACGEPNGGPCASAVVCRSGVCNADGECGDPNGAICASASTCRSGECDADGKCGLANADGPCTVGNGAVVCRSAVCDPADAKCGLANGDGPCTSGSQCRSNVCDSASTQTCVGCQQDADCGAGSFCNAASSTCQPKLANGAACARAAQCTSAVCDADARCGSIDGEACSLPAQCRSGQCTNGVCGAGADAGAPDAGTPDAGGADAGTPDAGGADAGTPDSGRPDAGALDAGTPDAAKPTDAAPSGGDATTADGSTVESTEDGGIGGGGCSCRLGDSRSDAPWPRYGAFAFIAALLFLRRRRAAFSAGVALASGADRSHTQLSPFENPRCERAPYSGHRPSSSSQCSRSRPPRARRPPALP